MKVAIVHYWLIDRRGGERVVEALCELYPQADVFTNIYDPAPFTRTLAGHRVRTTFVNRLPWAARLRRFYLPLMPPALERLDLRGYDLVITSESGPAKGVVTGPGTLHLCYCHSPMRYVWDMYALYLAQSDWLTRLGMRLLTPYLRRWDQETARRPHFIVANSRYTRERIQKYWKRDAEVIPPPVDVRRFAAVSATTTPGDYYLCAGELEGYKRIDLAVDAFNRLQLPLVIVGSGREERTLRRQANRNITFRGRVDDDEFARIVAGCRALVFPGEEDFGIVPVEAMAAGRAVIAYGHGGAVDTVVPGVTGTFFDEPTTDALAAAIRRFEDERKRYDPKTISRHAANFDRAHFMARIAAMVRRLLESR